MIRVMLRRYRMWRLVRNCRRIGRLAVQHSMCEAGNEKLALERECDRLISINVNIWSKLDRN